MPPVIVFDLNETRLDLPAPPATKCGAAGWTVAVVDDQPYGGTCALRGCDPKKVLVGAADVADWHRH